MYQALNQVLGREHDRPSPAFMGFHLMRRSTKNYKTKH